MEVLADCAAVHKLTLKDIDSLESVEGLAGRLVAAREGTRGQGCRLCSWNLRWMVDPAAQAAAAKRAGPGGVR